MPVLPLNTPAGYLIEDLGELLEDAIHDVNTSCFLVHATASQRKEIGAFVERLAWIKLKLQDLEWIMEARHA